MVPYYMTQCRNFMFVSERARTAISCAVIGNAGGYQTFHCAASDRKEHSTSRERRLPFAATHSHPVGSSGNHSFRNGFTSRSAVGDRTRSRVSREPGYTSRAGPPSQRVAASSRDVVLKLRGRGLFRRARVRRDSHADVVAQPLLPKLDEVKLQITVASPMKTRGLRRRPTITANLPVHSSSGIRSFADQGITDTSGQPVPVTDNSISPPVRDDGSLDYDALYEDEVEQDLGSMEHHGSVVTHLLSQVKIGMDLTKVVLPTFILERRSLLEMYADYFAHPDIFVKIADLPDPRERMVQVLRWYMSAYHAGRKSVVARKPYNPILGEIFQCHWNVPGFEGNGNPKVPDGPVPWCTSNQLTFVAEQVSHHPPISAFYAEHYDKKISFCAHVWTKSKFLGLSIGVHNIGQGCVSVLEHDEEYIVTFPNGYGRSILTHPWIELGGAVTINCAKTGYSANLEFLTKPFYGGKRHRITAEVFQPNDKKPFLTVSGEWNGSMEAKWSDGRTEVFVDVDSIPIIKKQVRPISEQDDNESRRLWKEVTAGLRLNNIERATNAKYELEQKQRDEAKERKEKDMKWETQLFQEVGENWIYKAPLVKRLSIKSKPQDLF